MNIGNFSTTIKIIVKKGHQNSYLMAAYKSRVNVLGNKQYSGAFALSLK
jgi:hypothetical protein